MKTPYFLINALVVVAAAYVVGRSLALSDAPYLAVPYYDPALLRLEGVYADVDLRETPIEDGITRIAKAFDANVVIDWPALERAGLDRKSTISFQGVQSELKDVLTGLEAGQVSPGFVVRGADVVFTTGQEVERTAFTGLYDLRPIYKAMYGRPMPEKLEPTFYGLPERDEFADLVCEMAESAEHWSSWTDFGGKLPRINERDGYLVVTRSPQCHVEIARLLNWLAKLQSTEGGNSERRSVEVFP